MDYELYLENERPHIIVRLENNEAEIENFVAQYGYEIGDNWWASSPDCLQPDGRWLLYLEPIGSSTTKPSVIVTLG